MQGEGGYDRTGPSSRPGDSFDLFAIFTFLIMLELHHYASLLYSAAVESAAKCDFTPPLENGTGAEYRLTCGVLDLHFGCRFAMVLAWTIGHASY